MRGPLGGMVWSNLQYLMGLSKLGHDVYFLEDSDDYDSCYDPIGQCFGTDPTYGLTFIENILDQIGFKDRWAYYDAHKSEWHGPCINRIHEICKTADMLVNLCGINPLRPWLVEIPARILIDEDPVFTQIRNLLEENMRNRTSQHTHFYSFGENIRTENCTIPDDNFPWLPTRQPIVVEESKPVSGNENARFTTVMLWNSYPAREYNNITYDMKSKTFEEYIDLPRKVGPIFEFAIGGSKIPKDLLKNKGWNICDPIEITKDVDKYKNFIENSKAEFSIVKDGYIKSNSGWFSERSAAYLTSGRPVITQDTGFSINIPCGRGLFAVQNIGEAVSAIFEVNSNYKQQSKWAREIAEEYFDYKIILPKILVEAI